MRTAEEILKSCCPNNTEGVCYVIDAINAINIARKETAISILEWSAKRGWESYVDEDRWICISQSKEVIDTETLYKRFEEDKNK